MTGEDLVDEDLDGELGAPPSSSHPSDQEEAPDIFISYRVRPDENLAGALKAMLESAIEPTPRVFVSGLGGLRASAQSYREQLRRAATSAEAYVALWS